MRLRQAEEGDLDAVVPEVAAAFGRQERDALAADYARAVEAGEAWVLDDGGVPVASCRLLEARHRLGGRLVPCLDVASVAVPPEHRGRGVARALLEQVIAHGVAQGHGLSTLYPSTTRLYRRLGWEHAGSRSRYRAPARLLPTDGPPMRRASDDDWEAIRACHERFADTVAGAAVRHDRDWRRLAAVERRFVLDGDDGLAAYALVEAVSLPEDWRHRLRVADWAATTAEGLAAVVALAAQHATMAREVEFVDVAPPRWAAALPEQDLERAGHLLWMARGLDLPAAVAARGFPAGLRSEVTFDVADPLAPTGPWRLVVDGGRGELVAADAAEARLQATAVGPLLTGFRSASELALLGRAGGDQAALHALDAAFAGPPPSMIDFF